MALTGAAIATLLQASLKIRLTRPSLPNLPYPTWLPFNPDRLARIEQLDQQVRRLENEIAQIK